MGRSKKQRHQTKEVTSPARDTLARKNIRPFADFSSKMAIFKVSEKYLNDGNSSKFLQFLLLLITLSKKSVFNSNFRQNNLKFKPLFLI